MKNVKVAAFKGVPTTYRELVRMHEPRPIRGESEFDSAIRVVQKMAGHNLNRDQDDYLNVLTTLIHAYDQEHHALRMKEMSPLEALQFLMQENGMNASVVGRFEKYGSFTGKGAILKSKTAGSSSTTKLFSFCHDGLRVMITQFCPDSNLKRADAGLSLIENSFSLRTGAEKKDTSGKPDASHGN